MEHMHSFELQCIIYFSYSPRRNFQTCIHMDYNEDLISAFLATTVFYKAISYHICSTSELAFLLFFFFLKAHSSVEKAGLIALVKMKFLPVDENFSLRGETLKKAIAEDRKKGLVPVFVCSTFWLGC